MAVRNDHLLVTVALLLLMLACSSASGAEEDVQLQIEKDVWIPLFASSDKFDPEGFLSVQSRDLVRISLDSNDIYEFTRYQREINDGFKRAKERGISRKGEARFLTRSASGGLAYETGYFRSHATLPGGEERIRYSKFEFVLRKERGKWRILVDKDSTEGGTITEEKFRAATTMKHLMSAKQH